MQRERADQSLRYAVAAVTHDRGREAVALRGRRDERADMIDERLPRGERARCAARGDDGRAALLHLRDEFALEPLAVEHFVRGLALYFGVGEVGVQRLRVVAPDRELLHIAYARAG